MPSVLLTGSSSFSGMWIAQAFAQAGWRVVAPLRRRHADYSGLRLERVRRVGAVAEARFGVDLTTSSIDQVIERGGPFDLYAHHAADIPNYRDPAYEVAEGVARNTARARQVFHRLKASGAKAVIATGTTFEADERLAPPDDLAVSPYGLSKTLTNQALRHFAHWEGLDFGRFVVAAPFGPWEEGRFVWSLFQAWMAGHTAVVRTPAYVRDNIPAPLLARAYVKLAEEMLAGQGDRISRPAGFVGTQGEFALRVAREAEGRLGRTCAVSALEQTAFPEPRSRVNDEPAIPDDWNATAFWDEYIEYYQMVDRSGLLGATPA
ncbi:NAD-dependent epimerase/dehydratase family protein [Phenylobacterium sp.]|uniref:NAD-dependent epimerase/dehydratase family protein n=1 Tax=Phenylobacterium sp. TaxID=1871053 RepID=UPI0035AF907E